jgi:uncharacterized protein (UPF0548 family)
LTNYPDVGATHPEDPRWSDVPAGYRASERTVELGHGSKLWEFASQAVLDWGIKTRSGFTVVPTGKVSVGSDYSLIAKLGPLRITEPATVVAVVERPDRCGFAYGTREGHPVRGEEAFVVDRLPDGTVRLTVRSLTSAPTGRWLLAYPGALLAQFWYRRRYLRALRT